MPDLVGAAPFSVPEHGTVAVWSLPIDDFGTAAYAALDGVLSADERLRAARYRREADRRRFVIVRGTLRALLGRCTGTAPHAVRFAYGPFGKPSLPGGSLRFNVSHAGAVGLIALCEGSEVGVDVEAIDPAAALDELTSTVLSPRERAAFAALPDEARRTYFFEHWVCKEAWLKAVGCGLSTPPDAVDVADGAAGMRLRVAKGEPLAVEDWWVYRLSVAPGYAAALAGCGDPRAVHTHHLDPTAVDHDTPSHRA